MKLKELEKRLKQEPDNLGLRVQVAGLMREAGRSLEAVELYRSVALSYRDQGRAQQAIAVCRSILEIAPEDAACQGLLGMLQGRNTPSRPPSSPSRPPSTSSRPPIAEPAASPEPASEPRRRSSHDETPLPRALPHHVSDPTSRPNKISSGELGLPSVEGADTRPGREDRAEPPSTRGLAKAARRISGLISDPHSGPNDDLDLAAELETRQRPRVPSEQVRTLDRMSSGADDDLDELTTHPPEEPPTDRVEMVTPPGGVGIPRPRDSDDELTVPRDRLPDKD